MGFSYQDIVPYTVTGNYCIDVPISDLEYVLGRYQEKYNCDLDPDFQRPLVWTEAQQIGYVEHMLRGGRSGRDILFNCPGWNKGDINDFVLVDGKQRLHALLRFLRDELPVFGHKRSEIQGQLRSHYSLLFHVNDLPTRKQVLQWYLDFNCGGTVHSEDELARVRALISEAK